MWKVRFHDKYFLVEGDMPTDAIENALIAYPRFNPEDIREVTLFMEAYVCEC
jgi:hypothetical protein